MKKRSAQSGFTLIELLVSLTIVTILAVAVYVALNPAQRLKDAKDARRAADVDSILTAIHSSVVDNKGTYPTNFPAAGTKKQLGTGNATDCPATVGTYCTGVTTICADLLSGGQNLSAYLKTIPVDPVGGTTATAVKSGYMVERDTNGIVTVTACYTDAAAAITGSR
jgi:prepilin-type N-terminal cleavage/methylation domain-containing protein